MGALLHLIDNPQLPTANSSACSGPDFRPAARRRTGREITEAYATGRGSFRLRARWQKEPLSHGLCQIVVSKTRTRFRKAG